ncbi:Yip1 family protein [Roseicyclus sp.]|uniref:Yip1 family protein n=1 Tax=Roseicyclus sp. TaxID=1914329 RepID=UPI003F9F8B89
MTDIATLGSLLRLARDTVANPREGATTVLSFAPRRQALWLMFALVVVASLMMGEIVALVTVLPADGPMTGPFVQSPLALGLIQAAFLFLMIHAIYHVGRFFGGSGSLEEAALLVIWLQFIFICVQVIQIVAILVLPPLAGIITILAVALFFWLLVNFIAVLHGFTSLGLVFVVTLLGAFGMLVFLSLVLASLGVVVPTA